MSNKMGKKIHAFTVEEYKERLVKVKADMESKGMDVMVVSDPANIYYISGYDALSYYTPQAVIISLDLDEPVIILRLQDHYAGALTCWMKDDNIIAFPDKYLWEPEKMYVWDFVADRLKERKLDKKTIGVEMHAYYYTHFSHLTLTRGLPDAKFVDATKLINWIRGPKSKQELEYMEIAARITENAMWNALKGVKPGVRENAVGAGVMRDQGLGVGYYGGDTVSLPPIISSGERTQAAHFTYQSEGYFQDNQLTYMELSGCYKRYHAPLSRTICTGAVPPEIQKAAPAVIEGLNVALDTIKEGVLCEDVESAWQRTINKYGIEKESRMGYTVGCSYAPVWAEESAYFKPGEKFALKENMTFHIMPGIWLNGYGMAITETLRVTKTGCETITKFPRKLFLADELE